MKKQTTTSCTKTWTYPLTEPCNPEAHIACCGNRMKSYTEEGEKRIYMEDGAEFQLEFYNNSSYYVKADITINGTQQNSALVLRPYQRFFLDRFMDEQKKFKFNTFLTGNDDIEKLKEIIEKNGRIKIEFYKECQQPNWNWNTYVSDTGNFGFGDMTLGMDDNSLSRGMSNTISNGILGEEPSAFSCRVDQPKEIETGRVEEGSKSNQDFSVSNRIFDAFSSSVFEYHIMPTSHRPRKAKKNRDVIVADDIRTYCPGCGRRLKRGWNFCAGCGKKF